ncbi:MAG: sulfatase-like hydrolase/transferase [Candidatus Latescibacterota bacterium]|nr:MAG: sulfatase-like hydrolase/transferase [Candidatus Latescibacterota bacterium]
MKRWSLVCAIAVLLVFGAASIKGCTDSPSRPSSQKNPVGSPQALYDGPYVIIVVIDGLRYTESFGDPTRAHIPYLSNVLAPQGTLFEDFRNEGRTQTVPGHAALLTGTWQSIANDGTERPDQPTLFEYFRKSYSVPQDEARIISGKSTLAACGHSTHPAYGEAYGAVEDAGLGEDFAVFERLLDVLQNDHPPLTVVNFASVDWAGHTGNWETYIEAIETADLLTAVIWTFLQGNTAYADNTYLFVTNDHGRHDAAHGGFQSHGDSCEGCQHVMLLVLGPDVRANHTVAETRTLRDICNTAGEILDCSVPHSKGEVLDEIFQDPATGIGVGYR